LNYYLLNSLFNPQFQSTPLIVASRHGRFAITVYLLEKGANINFQNNVRKY